MAQDRNSGREASQFGRENGDRIAKYLGAARIGPGNEYNWKGRRISIRSARQNTTSVGVLYTMLDRITLIIAAFEREDDSFDLYSLDVPKYRSMMRETRSQGPSAGQVGIVDRKCFEEHGERIGRYPSVAS